MEAALGMFSAMSFAGSPGTTALTDLM